MITCPHCQAQNPNNAAVCPTCQAPIPHRYLWAASIRLTPNSKTLNSNLTPGQTLANRYAAQQPPQILLDLQPGLTNDAPSELPDFVRPYLFLTSHPVNVPRPYALLPDGTLLLEEAAIVETLPGVAELMPALLDSWGSATPLRQLGWLGQVAQLWQPCSDEQVAGTLLQLPLCRVDGAILKLLEVQLDTPGQPATLSSLGEVWQPLVETAHKTVQPFLAAVCQQLSTGQIQTSEQLVDRLDQGIEIALQQQSLICELAILTDQGPSRQRNEDMCYPTSGTTRQLRLTAGQPNPPQLLMVCDGIGGHQGGDVASKLAVAVIEQKLKPLLESADTYPDAITVTLALEQAICAANDEIAQQNDQEARQARDRMGTTVVLGLVLGPQLYLAHVGDSRAYRISPRRCQQVTLDDDVAAREVRLGYSFYRSVVDQPGTGALVQALGMTNSASLYPNVQRFLLDEDSVYLLCSDGLSDSDRVEQFWQTELLPLVQGKASAGNVARALIQLANTYNGHDNVTVGLLRFQPTRYAPKSIPMTDGQTSSAPRPQRTQLRSTQNQTRLALKAVAAPEPLRPRSVWPLLLGLITLVGLVGGAVALWFSGIGLRSTAPVVTDPGPIPADLPNTAEPNAGPPPSLAPLTYAVLVDSIFLQSSPDPIGDSTTSLPRDTVVQVLSKQDTADQTRWVQIRVCGQARDGVSPTASAPTTSPDRVLAVDQGWILESQLAAVTQTPDIVPASCD